VNVLAAPTYDADGIQELVLTLYVGEAITGAEIARRGAALVAVADAVTADVGGFRPHHRADDTSVRKLDELDTTFSTKSSTRSSTKSSTKSSRKAAAR
jgi:hypothetical protein